MSGIPTLMSSTTSSVGRSRTSAAALVVRSPYAAALAKFPSARPCGHDITVRTLTRVRPDRKCSLPFLISDTTAPMRLNRSSNAS
eukprot:726458-Prorocentrum_minimum.AAC.1